MKYVHLLAAFCLCCIACSNRSGEEKQTEVFDYGKPVDVSSIRQAYDWYQQYDGDDGDSILCSMVGLELHEEEIFLFEDTAFVLRAPEYAGSQQPFLAIAEDFYNSCSLSWNVWSNYEVWYRGQTSDLLRSDEDVMKGIDVVSADIIRDSNLRRAAQNFKDSLLLIMETDPSEWDEDFYPQEILISYNQAIESIMYRFYDDEEAFIASLDSISDIAQGMAMTVFQHYLDAEEENQVPVMLEEIAVCQTFDEQCSLWCNWANCKKSVIDDIWITAVGQALMESGNYSPILHHIWVIWRAIFQRVFCGVSRDSTIPNQYYNEYRKKCYVTCLQRIARHPNDAYAMSCAAAIGGRTNMNRFGQNYFGNEAMIELMMMLPNRYTFDDSEDLTDLDDADDLTDLDDADDFE